MSSPINYELALELKNAGFPQNLENYEFHTPDCKGWDGPSDCTKKTRAVAPTLSELIEVCGKNFHCLVHTTTGGVDSDREFWSAGKDSIVLNWSNGSAPEEAVARLWLALNKKKI